MTEKSVDQVIKELRKLLSADTDSSLARKLRVDKSTISSWRSRDSVPKKFLKILEGTNHQQVATPPIFWGGHEDSAFELAMFRFSRATQSIVAEADYRKCIDTFKKVAFFWRFMDATRQDIVAIQNEKSYNIDTAVSMLIFSDLEDGQASIERDRKRLDI